MEERTGVPAIDDAAYLRELLRPVLEDASMEAALIPRDVADEIVQDVQKIATWIPFPREIRGEFVPVSRWTRLRWRIRAFSLGDWIHDRLFPECARRWEDHVC